jgi:hypothetical protein
MRAYREYRSNNEVWSSCGGREEGLLRLAGKEYVVKGEDVLVNPTRLTPRRRIVGGTPHHVQARLAGPIASATIQFSLPSDVIRSPTAFDFSIEICGTGAADG